MKNSMIFLMIGTILMTACSIPTIQTSWSKPGAQPGEFERVQTKCEEEQGIAGLTGEAGFIMCMKRKGWFLIEEPVQ